MTTKSTTRIHFGWLIVPWLLVGSIPTLDMGIGLLSGWRPTHRLDHILLVLLCVYYILFFTAVTVAVSFRKLRHHAVVLTMVLCIVVVGLMFLEIALRMRDSAQQKQAFHHRAGGLRLAVQPSPTYLQGIQGISNYITNENGFREIYSLRERQHSVLVLGGGNVECRYLDNRETWPAYYMRTINERFYRDRIWVGNAGINGLSLAEQLRFLEISPVVDDLQGMIIQPGIQDLCIALFDAERGAPRNYTNPFPIHTSDSTASLFPLWRFSRILHELSMLTFSSPKAGFITPGSSNGREYETLRQQRRAASVVDTLPDLDASLKEFRELLHSTIDVSLIHDMPMAFVTQPVLWQEDLAEVHQARCWMGNLGNTTYLSMAALRQAMDAYNHVLLDVCRERAVPCVDLAAMHGNAAYFYDDYHLTEEGAKQTAHLVAKDLSGWINETILSRRDGENTQNTNRGRRGRRGRR